MKNELTEQQNAVINEFVALLKSNTAIITAGMLNERLNYDFIFGQGQTIELLNDNFYGIIAAYALEEYQIIKLAKEISHRENRWISGKLEELDFQDVIYDGYGYVVMSDGTRVDIEVDMYREEREAFNKVRNERLSNKQTNGKEYLTSK
jgi:hypothetical protein